MSHFHESRKNWHETFLPHIQHLPPPPVPESIASINASDYEDTGSLISFYSRKDRTLARDPKKVKIHTTTNSVVSEISSLHFAPHLLKRVRKQSLLDSTSVGSGGISEVLKYQTQSFNAKKKKKQRDFDDPHTLMDVIHDVQSVSLVFHDLVLKLGSRAQQQSFQKVRDTYLTLFERALKVVLTLDKKRELKLNQETKAYNSLYNKIGDELDHLKQRNQALKDACAAKDVVAKFSDQTITELENEVT